MSKQVERPDFVGLAEALTALAYPSRLEILDQVRFPRRGSEIRVTSGREAVGANPERAISKQAVAAHLDKLVDAGLVRQERHGIEVRYVTDASRLYALVEDLRHLCLRYAPHAPGADQTGTLGGALKVEREKGPRLVLVHGVFEGRSYPLTVPSDGPWSIGRNRNSTIPLDYDPYVSSTHAEIVREGDGFAVRDLASSKNGTFLNWEQLSRGDATPLAAGDVLGVGRSLLSFRPA